MAISTKRRALRLIVLLGVTLGLEAAEEDFEKAPIHYSASTPVDAVSRLSARLASGDLSLGTSESEILRTLLHELNIPESSQLLVFSRTSLQRNRISPDNPRALYYSDTCYVGWVPGGLIEVTSIDPVLGPVFYAIDPRKPAQTQSMQFVRDQDCLRCHGGHFVRGIPGVMARSVFPDATGEPLFRQGSTLVDYRTPFDQRWGGWYVTGTHGAALHRGNITAKEVDNRLEFPVREGANITDLSPFFRTNRYPTSTSDIVSLLVFEHQIAVQNAITKASHDARRMLQYQAELQAAFKETITTEPAYDSVKSVFASATQSLVDALLSKDEATLPHGIHGSPEFANAYAADRVIANNGHSLRDLSL